MNAKEVLERVCEAMERGVSTLDNLQFGVRARTLASHDLRAALTDLRALLDASVEGTMWMFGQPTNVDDRPALLLTDSEGTRQSWPGSTECCDACGAPPGEPCPTPSDECRAICSCPTCDSDRAPSEADAGGGT